MQFRAKPLKTIPLDKDFERIASIHPSTRRSRLKKIEHALKTAVPQFEKLEFIRDNTRPHLQARYSHWCSNEESEKTSFRKARSGLDSCGHFLKMTLLEEPELSLNHRFSTCTFDLQDAADQVLVSTQSDALLIEPGIDGREVLMLTPEKEGTVVKPSSDFDDVCVLLKNGFTAEQLSLLE